MKLKKSADHIFLVLFIIFFSLVVVFLLIAMFTDQEKPHDTETTVDVEMSVGTSEDPDALTGEDTPSETVAVTEPEETRDETRDVYNIDDCEQFSQGYGYIFYGLGNFKGRVYDENRKEVDILEWTDRIDPSWVSQENVYDAELGNRYAVYLTPDQYDYSNNVSKKYNPYFSNTYAYCHYVNDAGEERLAIYLDYPALPRVLLFATDLGSTEALRIAVDEGRPIPATLLSVSNVSPYWSCRLFVEEGFADLPAQLEWMRSQPLEAPYTTEVSPSCGHSYFRSSAPTNLSERYRMDFYKGADAEMIHAIFRQIIAEYGMELEKNAHSN